MSARRLAACGVALSTTVLAGGGAHTYKIPPKRLCGVPDRPYQGIGGSPPVGALSHSALLVAAPLTDPRAALSFKCFQLAQTRLGIDHCVISRVSVTLNSNGEWAVSVLAEQNPRVPLDPGRFVVVPDETRLVVKQTSHIKRNKFFVRVRCYAPTPLVQPEAEAFGRPLLLVLEPPPFWVQNGQPVEQLLTGIASGLPAAFGAIDRVEVELAYR